MTRKQFLAALRKAGWVKLKGSYSTYVSPNGTRFQPDRYIAPTGVLWRHHVAEGTMPAEIDGDGYREAI